MARFVKRIGAAAIALVAAIFGGVGSGCNNAQDIETVYGPPPESPSDPYSDIEDVYGPPPGEDDLDDPAVSDDPSDDESPYSDVTTVYGPPEWFE